MFNVVRRRLMDVTRQAVMMVDRELLERLMPDWETRARSRYGDMVDGRLPADVEAIAAPYHAALKLPANCSITGIATNFFMDRVMFRIACLDFVETERGEPLPEVWAVCQSVHEEGKPDWSYFLRWGGPAVETHREYGFDGVCAVTSATQPNSLMSWDEYRAAVNWCVGKFGSAYVWKIDNNVGEAERWVLPPMWVWKRADGDYVIRSGENRIVALSASEVEVVKTAVGPSLSDGEKVMQKMEQWALSGPHFQLAFHPIHSIVAETASDVKAASVGYRPSVERSVEPVPENLEAVVRCAAPCWRCSSPTIRRLPDGVAECQECAGKPLL